MTTVNTELLTLFDQVDDWFEDITQHEPISQFILDEDRTKLALISRTTGNWFKSLSNPQLSDIELDEEDLNSYEHERKVQVRSKTKSSQQRKSPKSRNTTNSINKDETLDSLAKDLELLLDDDYDSGKNRIIPFKNDETPEFYFYNIYADDELALLDNSVGHSCTLSYIKEINHVKLQEYDTLVDYKTNPQTTLQQTNQSNSQYKETNPIEIEKLPQDHDYLAKARPKPLVLSNKFMQSSRHNLQEKKSSVLITEAIKRFARFSDDFRILSKKTDENSKLQ